MAVSQVAACPAIKDQHSTPPQQVAFTRGLRWADMQPDDLASAIGVYATAIIAATETMRPPSRCFR